MTTIEQTPVIELAPHVKKTKIQIEGERRQTCNNLFIKLKEVRERKEAVTKEERGVLKEIEVQLTKMARGGKRKSGEQTVKTPETPVNITPALCKFLNMPVGSQYGRRDFTKYVNNYITEYGLRQEENKKYLDFDKPGGAELWELILPKDQWEAEGISIKHPEIGMTGFELQKFTTRHFEKTQKNKKAAVVAPVVVAPVVPEEVVVAPEKKERKHRERKAGTGGRKKKVEEAPK